ncbi:hypothetical protein N7519_007503 [Penicillium mononematosum]|uniref:uncharacterized protein n=1 Tax=Penicillium mononematosum TaxID=268346 RepID=UPI002546BC5A|nr:uncharacterized protein N7519_007503 [Penicillium mononematosum]KAJ6186202.1 hypothetical protein N7519_007503 [Penicillium mononematosum]
MAGFDSTPKTPSYEPAQISEVGSEPQIATTEYKRHPVYSPKEWLLESISSILALGLLIAIAIIFWYMDNKPLSAWRAGVSLNATVSILTTACTTALMYGVSTFIGQSKWLHFRNGPRKLADFETFDEASRGVWGSILLLTTVKWNIATIGAFITILRLAFSPFAQQVVLIKQRDIISPSDTATLGYAHNYTINKQVNLANSRIESIPQDPDMQSAIYQGLYGINTTEPFNCPGTCRWTGPYISLGFNTQCRNVTQETLQTTTCVEAGNGVLERCNMTTPGGVVVASLFAFTDLSTAYYMNASSLMAFVPSTPGLPPTFPEIVRLAVYRSSPDANFQMRNINITECSLSLAVYEYREANATGSDFSFESRQVDFGVKNPWTLSNNTSDKYQRIYINETTTSDGIHIPTLEMSYRSLEALGNFYESPTMSTEWVEGNYVNTNLGVAATLTGDVDLGDRFNQMATAMTTYLRYGPNTQSAHGEVIRSEPFVFIRWGYFVVPIVTEGFAVLFAILSIFSNRRSRRVPVWKSSTLAVLACQHEERLGLLQTTDKDIYEIGDEAKKAEVRLP